MVKLKITKFVKILSLAMAFMTLFGAMAIIPDAPIYTGMTVHAAANGTGTYRITTSAGLNMRAGPSTGYNKIIAIPYNTNVDVSNIRRNWGQTTYKGRSGWICLDYATKVNVGPYVPVKLPLSNGEYYIASALNNNKFVDCSGSSTSNGANVLLWDAHYGDNQKVQVTYLNNGCYKIVFKHSGKCLDVAEVSKKSGANVHQWAYGGGANQQWILADAGNGYFYIIAQHSGKCLDVSGANTANGTNIQVYEPNKTNAQKFKFIPTSSVTNTSSWDYPMKNAYCTWSSSTNMSWANHKYGSSGGRNYHLGLDIYGLGGTVYAAADGIVKTYSTSNSGANGRFVIIEHQLNGKTVYSFYAHLSNINTNNVRSGQSIAKGTEIGTAGGSGNNSNKYYGTHLHFAIVDTYWSSGRYWGYAYSNAFNGNTAKFDGVTYYNPNYIVKNDRLP